MQALILARPPSGAGEHRLKKPPTPALRVTPGPGGASARRWIQMTISLTQVKYGVWMTAGYHNLSYTENRGVTSFHRCDLSCHPRCIPTGPVGYPSQREQHGLQQRRGGEVCDRLAQAAGLLPRGAVVHGQPRAGRSEPRGDTGQANFGGS